MAAIRQHPDLAGRLDLIESVDGVGLKTAVSILVRMPEIGRVTREQAAALAGLAPYDDDSGVHAGVRHIAGGRERLRGSLYKAALPAAFRENARWLAPCPTPIAAGKPHKVALIACLRKPLVFVNTVVSRRNAVGELHITDCGRRRRVRSISGLPKDPFFLSFFVRPKPFLRPDLRLQQDSASQTASRLAVAAPVPQSSGINRPRLDAVGRRRPAAAGAGRGPVQDLRLMVATLIRPARMESETLPSELAFTGMRRNLRLASGLVLFIYITLHLLNHALGLISLAVAEKGLELAVELWSSPLGTLLLYGAFAVHFLLALWAVYERRTFRLPPAELLRIALGFALPILLIGHAANTRLAYDLFGLASDYARVISNLWASGAQGQQLGLLAPGWLHGCLGLHFAFNRRPLYRQLRYVLFGAALLLPTLSALGFIAMGRELAGNPAATAAAMEYLSPAHAAQRIAIAQWQERLLIGYFAIIGATFGARAIRNLLERSRRRLVTISYPGRTVRVPRGWSVLEASRGFHLAHASMCGGRARCSTCRVRVTAGEDVCPARKPTSARRSLASARLPACASPASCGPMATSRSFRWCARSGRSTGRRPPSAARSRRSSCCSATFAIAPSLPATASRRIYCTC